MYRILRLTAAISFAAALALTFSAIAQERDHHQGPPGGHPGQGRPSGPPPGGHPGQVPGVHPGQVPGAHPGQVGHPGQGIYQPGAGALHHGPPGGPHVVHALGERGYSFRGAGGVRRELVAFSPRERQIWVGGRWHHERRFGRLGYWYEVNGSWYFYDRPFDGPPTYVSEVEFVDPVLGEPEEVVVAPAPVLVVPPAVCIGPLCVR